ncbi:helix-turn-helix domain-containing protein [Bifidobacterium sp. M0353]|uniref:helix-turn-helix domain-containing protein n=1 Tax=Bifidobacterium sp. M0353 TaxID=2751006 RepID=UPI0018DD7202|nr:helix-turn-helix transcriptional regulator [Bifidobacterium sp. M0353]MBI0151013.1 helix-turn-helix transcriptional regulator [Bifidobacterium sp. M0353]
MTVRNRNNARNSIDRPVMVRIGEIIKQLRKSLTDVNPPTREGFIDAGSDLGLPADWITEKSLANIENGLNMPSLRTLYNLSIALQTDTTELFIKISQAFLNDDERKPLSRQWVE